MTRRGTHEVVVCAMGKDVYLDLAGRWIEQLREAGWRVGDMRASLVDRAGLLDAMDNGPALLLYAGHGRSRGWAGYQTVRWEHLAARPPGRPAGIVIALACDTLAAGPEPLSFGERLVREGRARAYVGAVAPLQILDGIALGNRVIHELVRAGAPDIGSLMQDLADAVEREGDEAAARALAVMRVVGESATPLRPHARPLPIAA